MDSNIFETRRKGLNNYLTILENRFRRDTFTRKDTFLTIIKCLQGFGNEQFRYFEENFSARKLKDSDKFPYENVLTTILDQISYDIALIERAANQRNHEDHHNTLQIADYLAYKAIEPMLPTTTDVQLRLRSKITVLTYFQKSTTVRVIPYAPIVLVGIPFTCLNNKRDFLAIPHEVGHYIYRHCLFGQKNVSTYLREKDPQNKDQDQLPDWIKNWLEEIFADVYGGLIAGPVIGLSFQDLQLRSTVDNFYNDDGEHPIPLLRPHIYINVIENSKPEIDVWADWLRSNWSISLTQKRDTKLASRNQEIIYEEKAPNQYGHEKERKIKLKDANKLFKVENLISTVRSPRQNDARKPLDIAIKKVRYEILAHIENASWPQPLPAPNTAVPNVDDLYTHFEKYITDLTNTTIPPIPELTLNDDKKMILIDGEQTHLEAGKIILSPDEIVQIEEVQPTVENPEKTDSWLKKLYARGWATRGPVCEGSGTCD